jgi:hypothetical protein
MPAIHMNCPKCHARIKAPAELLGQTRTCPGCHAPFLIRQQPPEDCGPVLVQDEGETARRVALR